MKLSNINKLLITQFLSALADNIILMATIHIIIQHGLGNAYVGIVQASFLVAYVILAPYAGSLSERFPKSTTLWMGNVMKLLGAGLLLSGADPALSYGVVGIGACIYSPGKYGILKELTHSEDQLYKANGLVEGSTIVAILLGTVLGGILSAQSFMLAMTVVVIAYALSFVFAWMIPKGATSEVSFGHTWRHFGRDVRKLWRVREARIALVGTSTFWMTSIVLRLAVLAWIPLALGLSEDKASIYMGVSAIGIMFGSVLSPKIIPLSHLKRLIFIGGGMALAIGVVGWIPQLTVTGILLFVGGFLGGAFMIPLNTILQEKGGFVGSGKVIAIQNFFENILMLAGTLLYTGALKMGTGIPLILVMFAIVFGLVSLYVSRKLK